MKSNWKTREVDENIIDEFSNILGINKYLTAILIARGKTNITDAYKYLNPKLSSLHSPFLMKGMYEAVIRVRKAILNNEKIGIFSDSDLDGLTSLTIFIKLLERIGINPYYRFAVDDEEYGLRNEVIEEMHNNQVDLLITLDCGIRDIEEINYAIELGIDVIVCDHHEQGDALPYAIIVNPKLRDCNYPFKELAGVGVTFKLCHAILISYLQSFNKLFIIITQDRDFLYLSYIKNGILLKIEKLKDIHEIYYLNDLDKDCNLVLFDSNHNHLEILRNITGNTKIYEFKDLLNTILERKITSEPTINDLCELFSINKKVLKNKYEIINSIFFEIEYNNSSKIMEFLNSIIDLVSIGTIADIMPISDENRTIIYYGLRSLNTTVHPGLSLLVRKTSNKLTSKNIAWDISPLLNTPGRFGKTDLIADFFLERDHKNLNSIINEINTLNEKRKNLILELFDSLSNEIKNGKHISGKNLIFIASEKVPEGLCGLLANRIADATEKPVIIVSLWNAKEIVKGSGRTTANFNFFSFVESHSYLFEKIGGHPQAFGFTVNRKKIEKIKEKISESIEENFISNTKYNIDLAIPIEAINYEFINSLDLFEPYGYKNEECLFLTKNILIRDFKRFGKDMNHGKFIFQNTVIEAIGWNMADIMEKYLEKKKIDIIYRLENNYYNGFITPRMLVVDID